MKAVTIMVVVIFLIALGVWYVNQGKINRQMALIHGHWKVCVDGVAYLQFPSGVTVKYNKSGMIERCD